MKSKGSILIVDDDEDVLITARMILRSEFTEILTENSPKKLESLLKSKDVDVVILDMNFKTGATSGNEGLFWLRKIKEINESIMVIMNTAYGDIQLAVECMKKGATDFMVKPWEKEKLLTTVKNIFQLRKSERKIDKLEARQAVLDNDIEKDFGEMIGKSKAMQDVFDTISQVAATDANVLILGENGTGKELAARAIHRLSKRKKMPFIKADLGALSETLFESELFGHKKGAFTDAKENRIGRFEVADGGTLFLDEIGNTSANQQTKLLSVLQSREVTSVGSNKPVAIDIRLVSATNKPIHELAKNEDFRQDLLYRINTIEIELPPLRSRVEDIPLLADHFIKQYSSKYDKGELEINPEALKKLGRYDWPGNIRELQHAIERAVIMAKSGKIEAEDFIIKQQSVKPNLESLNVTDIEQTAIEKAIEKHHGNLTKAAQELGMGRSTLYRKMEKYGL